VNCKYYLLLVLLPAILPAGGWQNQSISKVEVKQELLQKFQTLKTQYEQVKTEGYDVSEIEKLGKEAKQAFDRGNYKKAKEILGKASKGLEERKHTPSSTSTHTPSVSTPPGASAPTSFGWFYECAIYNTNAGYYKGGLKELTK
jgi:hypothetical protein